MNNFIQSNQNGILKALAYYDVFNFPLNFEELFLFSNYTDESIFLDELNLLLSNEAVFKIGDFYALHPSKELATERIQNDKRAKDYEYQAYKKSKLIGKFPYVKGVFISGSLSKGTMGDDGDIDYFIVTSPGRLWVARTLLIFYKKVFLLNSRKYFCINYVVDENSLAIEHQNRFTAMELVTLLPMVNAPLYEEMISKNHWLRTYYNTITQKFLQPVAVKRSWFQKLAEPFLNTKIGDVLDDFFMKLTLSRWKSKFGNMSEQDFNVALQTSKTVSKHHPSNFQKKVLQGFEDRMTELDEKLSHSVPKQELKEA
jgi:hypothetical protein